MSGHPFPTLWMDVDDILDTWRAIADQAVSSGLPRNQAGRSNACDGGRRVRFVRRRDGPRHRDGGLGAPSSQVRLVEIPRAMPCHRAVATRPRRGAAAAGAGKRQILRHPATEAQALRNSLAWPARSDRNHGLVRRLLGQGLDRTGGRAPARVGRTRRRLVVPGSPWHSRDYVQTVRWARDDLRMRFALLIHDIIPVRRPEWCDPGVVSAFVHWHTRRYRSLTTSSRTAGRLQMTS